IIAAGDAYRGNQKSGAGKLGKHGYGYVFSFGPQASAPSGPTLSPLTLKIPYRKRRTHPLTAI
ncbi:hypothetical protein, partial [Mesorhizobium sp. M5C.F.Ca.IN.020.32.2.1]|uniref:hypothetical protein n=1 Tax=Mesorhizobium sp. M5C.F.Ca.IN.020.32.2.1 TaxID=2496771 RepID=UPI0019D4751C